MFSQIHYEFDHEFTIKFLIWLWIHYLFCDLTMNSRLFALSTFFRSWNNYELTINFAIWLWFNCLLNEIIMNSLSFSQIYFEITMFLANSPWIHHLFANSVWAQYLFRDLTTNSSFFRKLTLNSRFPLNSLSFSRIHNEFTIFCDFTMKLHLFRFLRKNPLSISWFDYQRIIRSLYYELTKVPPNIRWIRYLFKFTMDLLSLSLLDYEFTIFSQIHFELTMFLANPL